MYIHFYNPVALWCVSKTPEWIAPNLITFVGFMFSVFPFIYLFSMHGTHMFNEGPETENIPKWFFFVETFCYFAYRMLDEMDGK